MERGIINSCSALNESSRWAGRRPSASGHGAIRDWVCNELIRRSNQREP